MSESHAPTEGTSSSAEEIKENVRQEHEATDLGAGEEEPDPATAENPPSDLASGAEKRGEKGVDRSRTEH
jgi:hypothetical protein